MRGEHGRSDGHGAPRSAAATDSVGSRSDLGPVGPEAGTPVLDFSDGPAPGAKDLSLVLTARSHMDTDGPVWVRHLPERSWKVLHHLGLDHLFQPLPEDQGPAD
jgi:hypothetical protein